MKTEEFFTRVVAPVGNLVIAALRGKNFWNVGNFDAAGAASKIAQLDADANVTVYFAVGTHENNVDGKKVTRRKDTAAWFKALALDLDCGSKYPYATQKDGATALVKALATFSFPDPLLVNSGNGLHAYWPLTEAISAAHWEKMSIALRLALQQGGLQFDVSKIHDTSMVLRPVGTHHKKQTPWKLVEVLLDCPDYDVLMLASKLQQWAGKGVNSAKLTPRTSALSPVTAAILSPTAFDPLNLDTVAKGCNQIAALLASGGATDAAGADVREPLWRASLGIANYTADKQDAVVRLCGKHPDFDLQANLDKLAKWGGTGPTTCAEFEKHCPSGCVGCPSKNQIKSPAALSVQTQVTIASAQPAVPLPPGYFRWGEKIWQEVVEKDEDGQLIKDRKLVCDRPLVVLCRYTNDEKAEACVQWSVKQPMAADWRTHELPMGVLQAGGSELLKYFGDRELVISPPGMLTPLKAYMLSFLDYQQKNTDSGSSMESYGWQKDSAFLCGNDLLVPDGTVVPWRPSKGLIMLSEYVGKRGDRATWVDMTKLLDRPDAHIIAFSMLVAGSGLLLPGSELNCYLYSLFSEDTGTGKTFSLHLGNSLFGHPSKLLMQPNDTENAQYRIMGSLGSLSSAMDEFTIMVDKDPDRAANFALTAQTGREKNRMTMHTEMRGIVEWQAPVRVTTNRSLFTLYDNRRVNEAEYARTLEMRMEDKAWVKKHDVLALKRLLVDNHGFAVPEIATEIMRRGTVRDAYDDAKTRFGQAFAPFTFEGDERFYAAGVIAAYGIGRVGFDLGLFHFNIESCVEAVLERIERLRTVRINRRQDCFDSIGQFLLDMNDRLVVWREDRSNPTRPTNSYDAPVAHLAVARLEIIKDTANPVLPGSKLMVSNPRLREWTKKTGEDFSGLVDRLKASGALLHEYEKVTLHKGTSSPNPGQASCIVLNLCHPRFAAVLNASKAILNTNVTVALLQGGKP